MGNGAGQTTPPGRTPSGTGRVTWIAQMVVVLCGWGMVGMQNRVTAVNTDTASSVKWKPRH